MFTLALIDKAKLVVIDNADTLLTGVGALGTAATAYLTGRASYTAAHVIVEAEKEIEKDIEQGEEYITLTKWSKVRLTWRLYLPAVAVGTTTVTSIVVANRLSAKKLAALALASGISERALTEYKAKVLDKFTDRQNETLRDEIAQDRINNFPPGSVMIVGSGKVLCYDMLTGRYFESTVEDIKRAENKINHILLNQMSASLSEFYDEIGLEPTTYTDAVGWNDTERFEVKFSTVMSPDQRPCVAIDFMYPPQLEYAKRYH
jgi:hypothetical protein